MRGRTSVEKTHKGDREQIIVHEIPYQVNKARLVAKIAECMKDKRIEGISEVRDESDREGMRIVIELKKDAFPQVVLNQLFRLTDLQASFGVINLSIAHGRPAVLSLKETLEHFVEHRREVVTRRTRFELRQAEAQRELVEGLGMATSDIDRVIATIRASADTDEARDNLLKLPLHGLGEFLRRAGRPEAECAEADKRTEYFLSERQAKAILEMRLSRLTGLEREKLAREYGELSIEIERLRAILADAVLLMNVIVGELEDIKTRFADKRRTDIVPAEAEINKEDLIQEEDMVVTISHNGYVKRTAATDYRAQKRGGKGSVGMEARDEDWVNQVFVASTHSYVFFFSDKGKVYVKKVYDIPEGARNAKGRAIVNFVGMEPGREGGRHHPGARRLRRQDDGPGRRQHVRGDGDAARAGQEDGPQQVRELPREGHHRRRDRGGRPAPQRRHHRRQARGSVIATRSGMSIHFSEEDVRATGRATMGVKGIELDEGDVVVGLCVATEERSRVLAVCERGYGKQTPLEEFRKQSRGGKGVILIDASERNGPVVGVAMVGPTDEVILVTDRGQMLRTKVSQIRETGRNAQGVRLMNVDDGERVVAIDAFAEADTDTSGNNSMPPDSAGPPTEPQPGGPETVN